MLERDSILKAREKREREYLSTGNFKTTKSQLKITNSCLT